MIEGNSRYQIPDGGEAYGSTSNDHKLDWNLNAFGLTGEAQEKINHGLRQVMDGKQIACEQEIENTGRWYKARWIADIATSGSGEWTDGHIVGVLGATVDITDMKVRASLEIANKQLHDDEQLAKEQNRQKSQFLANMSHEIRTPVAVGVDH